MSTTFNRSVDLNTLNATDYALFQGDNQSPWCSAGSYSHSQDDTTVWFNCSVMPSNTVMTAMYGSGITDWQGNPINNSTDQFTTTSYDSNTAGMIGTGGTVNSRPGNGATGVGTGEPITFFLNLPVVSGTAQNGIEVAENNAAVPGSVQVLDNGYVLVFTPSSPWTPGALIQWWTTSTLLDATYETPFNTVSGYFTVAASTATLTPTIQVTSPPSGTNPAALNTVFDTQFNTPINPSTISPTTFYLYDSNTSLKPAVTYSEPQPNVIRMVPTSALTVNHTYYVYVTSGLQSTTSVPAASANWYVFTTSATVDSTLPAVQNAVPYNGASNIGINVNPGVVISKPVDPTTITSSTFQITNSGVPLSGSFSLNSTDTRIEFVPFDALPVNTLLAMNINGVQDRVGNPINFSSTFVTGSGPENSAPYVVTSSIPPGNNSSVPLNTAVTVDFSTSMDVSTFTAGVAGSCGNFYIDDTLAGTCINTTLSWNSSQTIAYLEPSQPLSAGREYYIIVNNGTDIAGNTMSQYGAYYFYGEFGTATTAPTVVAFNPLSNATGVGTNVIIEAQFSAPIDPGTLSGVTLTNGGSPVAATASMSAGNTILQLVPSAALQSNTTYKMNIAGVKDPAGNPVTTVSNTFTTGATHDNIGPVVVSVDPPNNSTAGTNVTPKILFNKPINPIGVNNNYFAIYLNDTGQFIPATVTLSTNGLEVTLTPQIPLLPNTEYKFSNINGGGSVDEDGNYSNLSYYYFTTTSGAVTTGPTVTVSPANTSTGAPINTQVQAIVSANIDPISWSQSSITVTGPGNTPVAGTVSEPNNTELAFTPTSNLANSTTYTVSVSNFTDDNNNAVVPYSGSFTTGAAAATTGLTVTSMSPGNNSSNNAQNAQITLTFSQPLDPATVNFNTLLVMDG